MPNRAIEELARSWEVKPKYIYRLADWLVTRIVASTEKEATAVRAVTRDPPNSGARESLEKVLEEAERRKWYLNIEIQKLEITRERPTDLADLKTKVSLLDEKICDLKEQCKAITSAGAT